MANGHVNEVEFTQYLMPDGRQNIVWIKRSKKVIAKAKEIINAGFRFECEMLSDYNRISLTICDQEEDFATEIVLNGPGVPDAVDRLIMEFDLGVAGRIIEERAREPNDYEYCYEGYDG